MRIQIQLAFVLVLGLVLVFGQVVVAQEPGPTPSPESLAPNASILEMPEAQLQPSQFTFSMGETLTVPFSYGTAGVQTAHYYVGPLTVTVSGVGQAAGESMSDAFYIWDPPWPPWFPAGYYYNWTLWINWLPAENFVDPIPPYSPEHEYTFDMIAPGGPLHFAVGDTYTIDNTGQYVVQIEVAATLIDIDIKPDGDPNSINCNNERGMIPVAILTTDSFDATTVDHTTVSLNGASEAHVDPMTGEPQRHEEDVDYDGDIDLVFHFRLGDTDLTCYSEEGILVGETYEGLAIIGSDLVRMVPED